MRRTFITFRGLPKIADRVASLWRDRKPAYSNERRRMIAFESLEVRHMLAIVAWANTPFERGLELRDAIAGASANETVEFAAEYHQSNGSPIEILLVRDEPTNGPGSGDIEITVPLKIVGPGRDKVVISGNYDGTNDTEATRIFWIENNAATEVSGLTIANGLALGVDDADEGIHRVGGHGVGGAIMTKSPLKLRDMAFRNNESESWGGAVGTFDDYSDLYLDIERTIFEGNEAGSVGGAVFWYGGESTSPGFNYFRIVDSQIVGNQSDAAAIYVGHGGPEISSFEMHGTLVHGNISGGVSIRSGDPLDLNDAERYIISGSQISNNAGSGVFIDVQDVGNVEVPFIIANSSITGNQGGSGIHANLDDLSLAIVNSTISGNGEHYSPIPILGPDYGGGIRVSATFSSAAYYVKILNSTITKNVSGVAGAGIYISDDDDLTTVLENSIVSDNAIRGTSTPSDISGDLLKSTDSYYNIVGSGGSGGLTNSGTNRVGATYDDPGLGPLGNYFGTKMSWGSPLVTHLPLEGSPAVDTGDENFDRNNYTAPLSSILLSDERGFLRVANGRIDVGAVERQSTDPHCLIAGDYNLDGTVNAADYVVWRDHLGAEAPFYLLPNEGASPGVVDIQDYDLWRDQFGKSCSISSALPFASTYGDANNDGIVDMNDFDEWSTTFGSTTLLDADWSGNGIVDLADLRLWQEYKGVTTLDSIPGDFNNDGVVDSNDYDQWSDPSEEADFYAYFGMTRADVLPIIVNTGGGLVEVSGQAPQVTNITIGGPVHPDFSFDGIVGSGEQLRTVPVGGMNSISISFSEEVLVRKGNLVLEGMQGQSIPSVTDPNFVYDIATQTATWTFSSPLAKGQYLIRLSDDIIDLDQMQLDGEFDNPWSLADSTGTSDTFPSGNGEAGGEFRFRFTNLPSDFTRNNERDAADYTIWDNNSGMPSGALLTDGDADGDGDVDSADYSIWNSQSGTNYVSWPFSEPGMILVTTLTDEDNTNPAAMSLREALDLADDDPGHDTIVFKDSLFAGGMASMILGVSGQLVIDSNVSLLGPGADLLTITRTGTGRLFQVDAAKEATIRGVTLTGGYGVSQGGAIYVNGTLHLESSVVQTNTATSQGGGLFINSSATVEIVNSTIDDNEAQYGGGIFMYVGEGERLKLLGSTVSNNRSINGTGGGINLFGDTTGASRIVTVVNSTISNNDAPWSAGIRARYSKLQLDIINSTIAFNDAVNTGGGLDLIDSPDVRLSNTIVTDNSAGTASTSNITASLNTGDSYNNMVGKSGTGTGGLSHDPTGSGNANYVLGASEASGLTALGYFGGPTKTHAISSTSAAVDRGSNKKSLGFSGIPLSQDQRGFLRDVDYGTSGADGRTIDIGAFEFNAPIIVSTVTDENDGYFADGDLSLREALDLAYDIPGDNTVVFAPQLLADGLANFALGASGHLVIDSAVTINGPAANRINVTRLSGSGRIFTVTSGAEATIRGITISGGNGVTNGGGIYSEGDLHLDGVEVVNNHSTNDGGGIYSINGDLIIANSTIAENTAVNHGGGIKNHRDTTDHEFTVVNSTISGNSSTSGSGRGGGIFAYLYSDYGAGKDFRVVNSTITGNTAGFSGGGIHVSKHYGYPTATFGKLINTIVAGNTKLNLTPSDIAGTGVDPSSTNNLLGEGGSGGLTNSNGNLTNVSLTDIGLLSLTENGGTTRTHRLMRESLAIDSGSNSAIQAYDLNRDQRGALRYYDFDFDFEAQVDIGAYELALSEMYS